MRSSLLILVTTVALLAPPSPPARAEGGASSVSHAHLLTGVRAFRADHYAEALSEFRIVEQMGGAEDLAIYLGPTLFKLGRFAEARGVLARAHRALSPDPVADYYLGLTYHRLGLYRLAREVFAGVGAAAGPRLAEGSARFIAVIDAIPPAPGEVDRLLSRAETDAPDLAVDEAQEALLRAAPRSADADRAVEVLNRVAEKAGATSIARARIGSIEAATARPASGDVKRPASSVGATAEGRATRP